MLEDRDDELLVAIDSLHVSVERLPLEAAIRVEQKLFVSPMRRVVHPLLKKVGVAGGSVCFLELCVLQLVLGSSWI